VQGKVVGLFLNKAKGEEPEASQVLSLEVGQGIHGDRHQGDGDRQVSITSSEVKKWMEKQKEKGLCFGKFKENITIEGIDFENLREGQWLNIGQVQVELTLCSKKCYASQCELPYFKIHCALIHNEVFAKVITSGEIKLGDIVSLKTLR